MSDQPHVTRDSLPHEESAGGSAASGLQTTDFTTPGTSPTKRIRCPHCQNPIELSDDRSDEVLCPGCGGSFRLREAQPTTTVGPMRPLGKFQLLQRVGLHRESRPLPPGFGGPESMLELPTLATELSRKLSP
jgi:hypothetical protein